jgi:hypothetical protein
MESAKELIFWVKFCVKARPHSILCEDGRFVSLQGNIICALASERKAACFYYYQGIMQYKLLLKVMQSGVLSDTSETFVGRNMKKPT